MRALVYLSGVLVLLFYLRSVIPDRVTRYRRQIVVVHEPTPQNRIMDMTEKLCASEYSDGNCALVQVVRWFDGCKPKLCPLGAITNLVCVIERPLINLLGKLCDFHNKTNTNTTTKVPVRGNAWFDTVNFEFRFPGLDKQPLITANFVKYLGMGETLNVRPISLDCTKRGKYAVMYYYNTSFLTRDDDTGSHIYSAFTGEYNVTSGGDRGPNAPLIQFCSTIAATLTALVCACVPYICVYFYDGVIMSSGD
jgi:hypothetical protein